MRVQLTEVVGAFGHVPVRIRRIPRGFVNTVWVVDTARDRFVLKRATRDRATADLLFEHEVLAHLDLAGWKVPTPIRAGDGSTLVEMGGDRWWLARWLPGRAPRHTSARYGAWAGGLLARLHDAMAGFAALDPEPLRLRHVGDWPFHPTGRSLRSRLDAVATVDLSLAREIEEAIDNVDDRMRSLSPAPHVVTHFDFHHANLRVSRGQVAVLDFDFAHTDEAVADIATALHFIDDEPAADAFVQGYNDVRCLTDGDLMALPVLFDARKLLHAAWLMTQQDLHSQRDALRQTLHELGTCPFIVQP